MPAKRDINRLLSDLERKMDELEASEARSKASVMQRRHSDEDIIEIAMIKP